MLLPALLFASVVNGKAALDHAAKLASLGPHAWGSPRATVAAAYVESQFRDVGLEEVRLHRFDVGGLPGTNVVGVLRAPGREFVVVGAHHDTAPEAPGAYDDGGGVGVLIEVARTLARERRSRTIVFVSFDGEEAWATGKGTTTGSRAYLRSLGPERRSLVAALVVEMCGWKGGSPVLHPIAYADPVKPGGSVVTPAWLLRTALEGAREARAPLGVGDPWLSWLYQPAVRTFRVRLYGDDLSFAQAGLPALFASDSSFSAYYPWYHQPGDTVDKLDADALGRMGDGILGAVRALERVKAGLPAEPSWFAAFGRVAGGTALLAVGALSLVPGLLRAFSAGGLALPARAGHAVLFGLLLWRHPVPAVWVFLLPNLAMPSGRRWVTAVSLAPAAALVALGAAAWRRGMMAGLWLAPWEVAVAGLTLALAFLPRASARRGGPSGRKPQRRSR